MKLNIKVPENVTRSIGKATLTCKKYSPEILLVAGMISGAACLYKSIKAGITVSKVMEEYKDDKKLKDENKAEYRTEEAYQDDVNELKVETTKIILKEIAAPVALGAISGACILASHGIIKNRAGAYAAAYEAINESFKAYRKKIANEIGPDREQELFHGVSQVDTGIKNEDGNDAKAVLKDKDSFDIYARFFDDSKEYCGDGVYDLTFLKCQEASLNRQLIRDGYLFLNDVYSALGFSKTRAGQYVGWYFNPRNPIGDNCVKFDIYNSTELNEKGKPKLYVGFNVDGDIMKYAFPQRTGKI